MRYFFLLFVILFACSSPDKRELSKSKTRELLQVEAAFETDAVSANPEDDAADDPAFWFNKNDPQKSLILGSNKTLGVVVFDMTGKRLQTSKVGRINNIDVRRSAFDGIDLLGGSNRDSVGMDFWRINPETLRIEYLNSIASYLPDVYGFCLYKNKKNKTFAFINSKTGKVEQWELIADKDSIKGQLVRELQLPGQVEGMVADDSLEVLFIGVEESGIFRFGAEPTHSVEGVRIDQSGEENSSIKYDVEGLTLYCDSNESGFLLASSQGNNTFAVFERSGNNRYLGSFEIVDGLVDGVEETDGIDAIQLSIGSEYPNGLLICQDGFNYENRVKVAQNFKIVNWDLISPIFER